MTEGVGVGGGGYITCSTGLISLAIAGAINLRS